MFEASNEIFIQHSLLQSVLKEKHERLERDQAEADTHLQVVTERHVKREADLRQSLQVPPRIP